MPDIRTGQTAHEIVVSFDTSNNNPISGATFDTSIFKDGALVSTGVTITSSLSDASTAVFDFYWSASTTGTYQLYIKNDITSVIYVSDIYNMRSDNYFDNIVYVGI